jgi:hypothetical protein
MECEKSFVCKNDGTWYRDRTESQSGNTCDSKSLQAVCRASQGHGCVKNKTTGVVTCFEKDKLPSSIPDTLEFVPFPHINDDYQACGYDEVDRARQTHWHTNCNSCPAVEHLYDNGCPRSSPPSIMDAFVDKVIPDANISVSEFISREHKCTHDVEELFPKYCLQQEEFFAHLAETIPRQVRFQSSENLRSVVRRYMNIDAEHLIR